MEQTTTPGETTSSAPTSFAEAAATLEASSASTPTETPTADPSAPAATTPAASDVTAGSVSTDLIPGEKGTIRLPDGRFAPPPDRWPSILENQRAKAAAEAEARVRQELEQRLKPYEGIDEQTLNGYRVLRAAESGDARARAVIAQANPQLAQAMGWTQAPQADPEPEPDFVLPVKDAQGNIVGERAVYSAEQLAKREAWNERRLLSKVDERVKPFQELHERDQRAQNMHRATTLIDRYAKQYPEFDQHMDAVIAAIQGDPRLKALAMSDPDAGLEIAWGRVHREKVLPTLSTQERASVLADIHAKTAATTANPSHTAQPRTTRPTDFYEAAKLLEAQGGAMRPLEA